MLPVFNAFLAVSMASLAGAAISTEHTGEFVAASILSFFLATAYLFAL